MIFTPAVTIHALGNIFLGGRVKFAFTAVICALALVPASGVCETYGVKDQSGTFSPKVVVTVGNREVLIKKTDPQEKFTTISLLVNKKNRPLVNNIKLLKVQWTNIQNQPGKPLPLVGPNYDPRTLTFQEPMLRSVSLKLIDESARDLFTGKEFPDLFALKVDDQPLISSEGFEEKDRTVKLGAGRDLSLDMNKNSILFNEENYKRGETIDVENRSEYNQTIGVDLPENVLLFDKILRSRGQGTIPKEGRDRFTVEAGSGFSIVIIPDPDAQKLRALDGSEVLVKVWDGNTIRDTRRIPIKVASELITAAEAGQPASSAGAPAANAGPGTREPRQRPQVPPQARQTEPPPGGQVEGKVWGSMWLWSLLVLNLVFLVAIGAYGIFLILPRIQVLEDRLAKNEMFLHGSREAIREELDEIKRDILQQCQTDISQK